MYASYLRITDLLHSTYVAYSPVIICVQLKSTWYDGNATDEEFCESQGQWVAGPFAFSYVFPTNPQLDVQWP